MPRPLLTCHLEVSTHGLGERRVERGVEKDGVVESKGEDAGHQHDNLASRRKEEGSGEAGMGRADRRHALGDVRAG